MVALCVGRGDEHREAGDALEVILLGVAYAPVAVVSLGMGIDVHFERRGHVPGARPSTVTYSASMHAAPVPLKLCTVGYKTPLSEG